MIRARRKSQHESKPAVYSRGERGCHSQRVGRGCEYRVGCGGGEGSNKPGGSGFGKIPIMSVKEIERTIAQLPKNELSELMKWLKNHHHEVWDQRIENDVKSGRLDALLAEVEAEYKSQC